MSKKNKMPFDDLNWSEIQKKYMDVLTAFNTQGNFSQAQNPFASMTNPFAQAQSPFASATNPFSQMQNPFNIAPNPFTQLQNPFMQMSKPVTPEQQWMNAINDWWQMGKAKEQSEDSLLDKVFEQCRGYYFMSDQFSKLFEGMAELKSKDKTKNKEVTSYINEQFKSMEAAFAANQNSFNWSQFVEVFDHPTELLKNSFSNMSMFNNNALSGVGPEAQKVRDKFLSIPGVGYHREAQDKYQEALKLWAQYQDNYQEYQTAMSKLNQDALDLMRKRIVDMNKKGEEIKTMREMYNLWVDSNETIYGKYVYTEEYSELNSKMINSLMAFKNKSQEITEDILAAMNMPTSKAINELERRNYELRKELKSLQASLKAFYKSGVTEKPAESSAAETSSNKKKVVKKKTKRKTSRKKTKKKSTKKKTKTTSTNDGMINLKF